MGRASSRAALRGRRLSEMAVAAAVLALAGTATASVDFAPRTAFRTLGGPTWLTAGDLNADGVIDLATGSGANAVVVHLGLGGGAYGAAAAHAVSGTPGDVELVDLNRDGKLDVVSANFTSSTISTFLGDGAGGLSPRETLSAGSQPTSVTAGDITGDGNPDLVITNSGGLPSLSLFFGDGTGGFSLTRPTLMSLGADAAIGDVTGDGVPDVVLAGEGIEVMPGPVDPLHPPAARIRVPGQVFAGHVALEDFNRDGRLDIATADLLQNDAAVALGLGGGGFTPIRHLPASTFPEGIATGDVNGDGAPDIAVANLLSGDVSVMEGTGTGGFRPSKQFRAGPAPGGIVAADITGDGRSDLLVSNTSGAISILRARPLAPGTRGTAKFRVTCPTPRRVTAGEAVSCIEPFMSPAQVVEYLGKPARRSRVAPGVEEYRYSTIRVRFDTDFHAVGYVGSRRPGVGLANGLRVGSPATLVKKRYPRAKCVARAGVRKCRVVAKFTFTGFVIEDGTVVEIGVGAGTGAR